MDKEKMVAELIEIITANPDICPDLLKALDDYQSSRSQEQ
jgi:hypothetical protein